MQENEIHHAWKTIIDIEINEEKEKKIQKQEKKMKKVPKHHLFPRWTNRWHHTAKFKRSVTDVFRKTSSYILAEEAPRWCENITRTLVA